MHKLYIVLIAVIFLFYACTSPEATKIINHQTLFIKGCNNNNLEVLDWGGKGTPILFLAGLGNTAHIFDDFAPKFNSGFHVYGLTRRGFGASEQNVNDYSENALVNDILSVIDSLHLNKVILIGHSIAGEEISKFASLYPSRVDKVIYLDAAYDRTTLEFKNMWGISIQTPVPTTYDSSSFAQWKEFNKRIYGFPFPDDELNQLSKFSKEGKYLQSVTPDSISGAIINGIESPDYAHITCPALALYAKFKSVEGAIPPYNELDSMNKKNSNDFFILLQKYSIAEQARFKSQVHNEKVKSVDGSNHYLFISNPVETEKAIKGFLK